MLTNIISWNTFGAGIQKLSSCYSDILLPEMANIILLQEAGAFEDYQYNNPIEITLGRFNFTGYFVKDNKANVQRCTTGILIQDGYFDNWEFGTKDTNQGRPVVAVYNPDTDYPVIATVHAIAEKHAAQREVSYIINTAMKPCKKWFLMGDLNCTPQQLLEHNVVNPNNISAPYSMTHNSETIIDYAIFSDDYCETKVGIASNPKTENVPLESDHFPIRAIIDI